jgi:hypothetical protein
MGMLIGFLEEIARNYLTKGTANSAVGYALKH